MKTRVVVIGIGGASCSGKTTLAKKLCPIIPRCSILHQDDFWTPLENVPIHPRYNVPNAEDAAVAIEWPRFRAAVAQLKANKSSLGNTVESDISEVRRDFDKSSSSFDWISDKTIRQTRDRLRQVEEEWLARGVKIEWRIVEGFFLFYDEEVLKSLDIRIFVRSPRHILQQRRLGRSYTYSTGEIWVDPPNYWEQISYSGYIRAHSHLFDGGDVDAGNLSQKAIESDLLVLNGQGTKQNLSFEELFREIVSAVLLKTQPTDSELLASNA